MTNQYQQVAPTPSRDSIFGVCAAVANDFGFNPLWLRLAIGAALMWNLEVALGTYVTLGAIVLISRLASPDVRLEGRVEVPETIPVLAPAPQQDLSALALPRAA